MAKVNSNVNESLINIIGAGTEITGQIVTKGDLRIDGKLKGDLFSEGRIVVGETGEVDGAVECNNIEVYGKIFGKLVVKELTMLKATSRLEADIITKKLGVEPGAIFSGHCDMNGQSKPNAGKSEETKA